MPSVGMRLIYFAMCDGFQFYHFLTIVFLDFLFLHKAYELDFSLEQDIAVMPPPCICAVRARGELWSPVLVVNAFLAHLVGFFFSSLLWVCPCDLLWPRAACRVMCQIV